jgi:hypothetical protein
MKIRTSIQSGYFPPKGGIVQNHNETVVQGRGGRSDT